MIYIKIWKTIITTQRLNRRKLQLHHRKLRLHRRKPLLHRRKPQPHHRKPQLHPKGPLCLTGLLGLKANPHQALCTKWVMRLR